MKLFHETIIKLNFPEGVSVPADTEPSLKICIISDIHYARWMKTKKLSAILNKMRAKNPAYIFIPGDLVDNNEEIAAPTDEKRLLNFLGKLGKIAPVLIAPGNHDAYRSPRKDEGILENPEFITKVNALDDVFYLSDAVYEDEEIYVFGYNQKPRYYDSGKKSARFIRPIDENPNLMLADLDSFKTTRIFEKSHTGVVETTAARAPFINLPKDKLKFALVHSPARLDHPRIRKIFAEFDYLVSGHMHFGVIPPLIFEIWRGERGLIAPGKKFFPKNARVSKKTLARKEIISGAVTNFSKSAARGLNALYPIYFTTLIFSKTPKTKIRRKYRR